MNLAALRRLAVARNFAKPADLESVIRRMGYVQADPIRAPARAQDLILRQRVRGYRIDDLERSYPQLPVVEDMLHNYGFFPREHHALLYPRTLSPRWCEFVEQHQPLRRKLLRYLDEVGEAHPRDVERLLGAGGRVNGWGGTSSATTLMLEALHREGRAEVCRRDGGIRVYRQAPPRGRALPPAQRADGLLRLVVSLYAPLTLRSLMRLVSMMGCYKPEADYGQRIELMRRRGELRHEQVDGRDYVWPSGEKLPARVESRVRLLAPFDPLVWDRDRFEQFWGWAYRFEAYTPPARRRMGYYALPVLWRDDIVGWANVSVADGAVRADLGYAPGKQPGRDTGFDQALATELQSLRRFLAIG